MVADWEITPLLFIPPKPLFPTVGFGPPFFSQEICPVPSLHWII